MLSPIVRDVQRQRCCKRGSGDGQRLSLDHGTTERSFNAVERRGSTLTCRGVTGHICSGCATDTELEFLVEFAQLVDRTSLGRETGNR